MIRALIEQTFDSTKKYLVLFGLSTDSKPVSGLITGSEFHEVDTGVKYEFDEVNSQWHEVGITEQEIKDEIDAWLDDHPEATTTVQDGAISYAKLDSYLKGTVDDVADLKTEMEQKANVDGSYSSLTAGNAEQLVSTVGVTDKAPYLFRTTGGSADVGDRVKMSEITGGTVAWNQTIRESGINGAGGSITKSNGVYTLTPDGNYSSTLHYGITRSISEPGLIVNHIYFASAKVQGTQADKFRLRVSDTSEYSANLSANQSGTIEMLCKAAGNLNIVTIYAYDDTLYTSADTLTFSDFVLFDLTQMFGSTIADYLFGLESGTDGAGIAKLKSWGFCTKGYYAYDAGTLLSVKTAAHKEIGFNQWDEQWENGAVNGSNGNVYSDSSKIRSKNYIPVVGGARYYFKAPAIMNYAWYDADKVFISGNTSASANYTRTAPANAAYLKFSVNVSTYANDICINLHWDGERDGEYEPYEANTYPLDDVELRGIPKLDASNSLYYDGDGYAPDGTVTRKYGIVDLGTLDWGTRTVADNTAFASYGLTNGVAVSGGSGIAKAVCSKYPIVNNAKVGVSGNDKMMAVGAYWQSGCNIYVLDSGYSNAASFKAAMSGVYLVYELATPTTESADPYQETQICSDWGSEEFVDSRTVPMPVGSESFYQLNLRAKLEMAPNSPSGDGDWLVRQTDGINEYVALSDNSTVSGLVTRCPACPTDTDGTFVLKATVSSGAVTYTWTAE